MQQQQQITSYVWHVFSTIAGIPKGLDTAVDAVGSLALDIGKGFENLGNLIDNHVIGKQIFIHTLPFNCQQITHSM